MIGTTKPGRFFDASRFQVSDEEYRRINPFDWSRAFAPTPTLPRLTGEGADGFDCIIGNPPYVRIQTLKEWAPLEVEMYKEQYAAARAGNYDIYVVFVEKALQLLNERGRLGFILPHKFFNAQYGEPLRELIARGKHLARVVHFGDQQIFTGATTYTCLMFLDKAGSDACEFVKVDDLNAWRAEGKTIEGTIPATSITNAEWNFAVGKDAALFERLRAMPVKLGDVADIFVGLQTSADDVFILDLIEETPRALRLKSKSLDAEWTFEKDLLFPLVSGTDVNRYAVLPERQFILFPYHVKDDSATLMDWETILKNYPKTAAYLLENKKRLEERERGKFKGREWYRFGRNQNIGIQERVKLCVPRLVEKLRAAYDVEGKHFLDNVDVGGITLKPEYQQQGLVYLLGLLNSNLLRWYFPFISAPFRGGWRSANRQFLSQLPIRALNLADAADKAAHDQIVARVTQMLELHTRLRAAQTAHDRDLVQRQIDATDAAIDELVYQLYGVTEEERQVVE